MIAAIRIKGRVNIPKEIKDTLFMLRLRQKFACSLYLEKPEILGMLKKVAAYISYGRINEEILKKLIEERGRKPGNKKLEKKEVDEIIKLLSKEKLDEAFQKIKPFFRLSPPRGGFKKSQKLMWPQGIKGDIGDKINELIERMI
ncbi:MAG: 50S ribosomal protein L30 [Candidatus Pacearchaeota archaeon]